MSEHSSSCLINVDRECGYCTCGAEELERRLEAAYRRGQRDAAKAAGSAAAKPAVKRRKRDR